MATATRMRFGLSGEIDASTFGNGNLRSANQMSACSASKIFCKDAPSAKQKLSVTSGYTVLQTGHCFINIRESV